jgi:hypothetical protein
MESSFAPGVDAPVTPNGNDDGVDDDSRNNRDDENDDE